MGRRSGQTKPKRKPQQTKPSKPKDQGDAQLAEFKKKLHDLVNKCELLRLGKGPKDPCIAVVPEALYHVVTQNFSSRLRFEATINAKKIGVVKEKGETNG